MTPQSTPVTPATSFTPTEQAALQALRVRYAQDRDLLDACECDRLRFMRWLYRTGRLVP